MQALPLELPKWIRSYALVSKVMGSVMYKHDTFGFVDAIERLCFVCVIMRLAVVNML